MMNINSISKLPKEDCCGCTACYSVCGKHAISMERDEQGFVYPKVDEKLCSQCGLCSKVCPGLSPKAKKPIRAYGVKHKVLEEQISSTSGGFAAALAENVIEQGGVVYGVVYKDVKFVQTCRIDRKEDLWRLKGSKYVQTEIGETFSQVLSDLKAQKAVAYFGTSCHIDGLQNYLQIKKADTSSLVTVDLICHGVPSPMLFEQYIDFLSRRKPVSRFYFRTKAVGWGFGSKTYSPSVRYTDGEKVCSTPRSLAFLQLFFSNNCLRPHCYQCPYAGKGRVADFTIADFWGLSFLHPDKFDKNGVSLVLTNTEKTERILKAMDNIDSFETTIENANMKQANQRHPSPKASTYNEFWAVYQRGGIEGILKKYTWLNRKANLKFYIRKCLGLFIKKYRD